MTKDERIKMIHKAIDRRVSAGKLAKKLGTTRNTILGFAWRNKIPYATGLRGG